MKNSTIPPAVPIELRIHRAWTTDEQRQVGTRLPSLLNWIRDLESKIDFFVTLAAWHQFILLLTRCLRPEDDRLFQQLNQQPGEAADPLKRLARMLHGLGFQQPTAVLVRLDILRREPTLDPIQIQADTDWGPTSPPAEKAMIDAVPRHHPDMNISPYSLMRLLYALTLYARGSERHMKHLLTDEGKQRFRAYITPTQHGSGNWHRPT